jgi:RNase P subunit RPR2
MGVNIEGISGVNLTNDLKRCCSNCNSSRFYVEATTSNAGAKGTEGLWFLCSNCGFEELIDFEAMGATADYS